MDIETLERFRVDGDYPYPPWTHDGHSYATDGRIIVRCPALAELPEDDDGAPRGNAARLFVEHGPVGDWVPGPSLPERVEPKVCPRCGGVAPRPCEDCEGTGVVTYEYHARNGRTYEREDECPVCGGATGPCSRCNGTGRDKALDPERKPFRVEALGVAVQLRYLRLIAALPGARLAKTTKFGRVVAFRADGGVEGLVMAMREG